MHHRPAFTRIHAVLLVGAAVAGGLWFWTQGVAPNLFGKRFAEVDAGRVYRSGKMTPAAISAMTGRHGLRTIIDLGAFPEGSAADRREQRTADSLGVARYRFDLSGDSTGNPNAYVQALRLMTDPANQPVLVHCGAGTERTGCAVVLYRHIIQGVPLDDAYEEARAAGQNPERNAEFARTLRQWAGPIEQAYRSGGGIPGVPALAEATPISSASSAGR
jgi:protein tyrosine/serine phosphatase